MADSTVVHIGENSPEHVAFKMMQMIATVEKREEYSHGARPVTREWILRTYAQCIKTVRLPNQVDAAVGDLGKVAADQL